MIDVSSVRLIIAAATKVIGASSPAGDDLVIGTGAQESHYKYTQQLGGGPALGYWQMEPDTHDDCWENYLKYSASLSDKVKSLLNGAPISASALVTNTPYAAAMCRVRYLRVHEPLPVHGDLDAYAAYYKLHYNTPKGAATIQEFLDNWSRYIAPVIS